MKGIRGLVGGEVRGQWRIAGRQMAVTNWQFSLFFVFADRWPSHQLAIFPSFFL